MYFKIMHNYVDVEKSDFFSLAHNSYGTRGHNLKLKKQHLGIIVLKIFLRIAVWAVWWDGEQSICF